MSHEMPRTWSLADRSAQVLYHTGSLRDFDRRWNRVVDRFRGDKRSWETVKPRLLPTIADTRSLRIAWNELANYGGQTPGLDRIRYDDLQGADIWKALRELSDEIKTGKFLPGRNRVVQIPKMGRSGTRRLSIPGVLDRVVAKSVQMRLTDLIDPTFQQHSFGYRKQVDRRHALATAKWHAERQGRVVWVVEDLTDCFDKVPKQRLKQHLRRRLPNDVVELIGHLIGGFKGVGLPQGSPISPLLLNIYLDRSLDRPWSSKSSPMLRVADDLCILCEDDAEARRRHSELTRLACSAGFQLRNGAANAIVDLRTRPACYLGFDFLVRRRNFTMLPARNQTSLQARLNALHDEPHAPLRAMQFVQGYLAQMAPALRPSIRQTEIDRVVQAAANAAFTELLPRDALLSLVETNWHQWQGICRSVTQRLNRQTRRAAS